jgi:ABC-type phosphate/phosphonate transport system permease subunit
MNAQVIERRFASEQFCSDTARSMQLGCPIAGAACAVRSSNLVASAKELHNMQARYPVFHPEYWVYMLAAIVMAVLGTLLYTVDRPINFFSWF